MKIKTSMKICKYYTKVWRAGYCDLQRIFNTPDYSPTYYNCGVYGWNCDLYTDHKHDAIITTGYRNTRGRLIPRELIEKYDKKARKIEESNKEWAYKRRKYSENAAKFLDELATI